MSKWAQEKGVAISSKGRIGRWAFLMGALSFRLRHIRWPAMKALRNGIAFNIGVSVRLERKTNKPRAEDANRSK